MKTHKGNEIPHADQLTLDALKRQDQDGAPALSNADIERLVEAKVDAEAERERMRTALALIRNSKSWSVVANCPVWRGSDHLSVQGFVGSVLTPRAGEVTR